MYSKSGNRILYGNSLSNIIYKVMDLPTPETIIEFWFAPQHRKLWFNSSAEFDQLIRDQFETTWQAATAGQLQHWQQTATGCLALAIVLDQFPLNMYRGQAKSFSTETQAITVTKHALQQGFDKQLPIEQLAFLYLPLMHSEQLADQELSLQLFSAAGLKENLRFAQHHRDLIARFGRFPHRNAMLGRDSTEEEIAYLNSKQAFKG